MKIKKFMMERQVEGEINIKNLVLHASAFGFYAFSVAIYEIVYLTYTSIYWWVCVGQFCNQPAALRAEHAAEITYILMQLCLLISEIILYVIFWQLSSEDDETEEEEDKSEDNET